MSDSTASTEGSLISSNSQSSNSQSSNSQSSNSQTQQEAYNLEPTSHQSSTTVNHNTSAEIAIAEKTLPTVGQLMRKTAQSVQRFLRTQLGHSPSRVTCNLVADKLIIWAENSVTSIEKLLYQFDPDQLDNVRMVIDTACRQQVIDIIEQNLEVEVVTLISDTCYEQECTGFIAALSESPKVRSNRNAAYPTAH